MFWKFLNDMSTSYHQAFIARWDRKNAEACQTDVILQMFNISNELEINKSTNNFIILLELIWTPQIARFLAVIDEN